VGRTHIYKHRTLKIKLEIKFPFDMVVKEVDARISDILKYYLKIYCRDTLGRSVKWDKEFYHVRKEFIFCVKKEKAFIYAK
jgi:hypothetical protein